MTVKDFLLTNEQINLTKIAQLMYPNNTLGAKQALYAKLKGSRNWTEKDNQRAKEILLALALDIQGLE